MEEDIWHKIATFWKESFPNIVETDTNLTDYTKHFPFLKLAEQSRIFFTIHKVRDLSLEYSTKNTEDVIGVTQDEFKLKKVDAFFEAIPPDHMKGVLASLEHQKKFYQTLQERNENTNALVYRCGVKLNHPRKGEIRLLWRSQLFEVLNDFNSPQRIIVMIQDITHLFKSDFFWFRAAYISDQKPIYITSRSDTEGYSKNDILSDREKETLSLMANGKSTDEVAKELFISKITVNNHRQNMLNKMGAKDVTALIQLAKLTKII